MRNAMSPDEGKAGQRECQNPLMGRCNIGRTCADSIQGESAGEERVCDLLLLLVEDRILPLPEERQGIDCRDSGP